MIEVAAGVLVDPHGRVLLMQRLPGKHLAGLWEFPGGKLEPGESVASALSREWREELGIEVTGAKPLISIPWQYPEKSVRLHALRITNWRGEPRAREGHPLRWVDVRELDAGVMPPADVPIVTALRLPACCVITAKMVSGTISFRPGLDLGNGASPEFVPDTILVQLRMPDASRADVRRVATTWLEADPALGRRLLVNRDIDLARELGVGVQLRSAQLGGLRERPLPAGQWVGASCHDAKELALAARLGADFATLSPVRPTASHPGAAPLGWECFAQLVADARLPVYALGGVGPADLNRARAAGAQGVAGIRAFRRDL